MLTSEQLDAFERWVRAIIRDQASASSTHEALALLNSRELLEQALSLVNAS